MKEEILRQDDCVNEYARGVYNHGQKVLKNLHDTIDHVDDFIEDKNDEWGIPKDI